MTGAEEGAAWTLERRLDRLGEIAARLEAGELELDQALGLFEEAVGHLRAARTTLEEAELRVEEMLGRAEAPRLEPLDRQDG